MNPLIKAIEDDSIFQLKKLIEEGVDLNKPILIGEEYDLDDYDEIKPLFYAIRKYASLDMIKLFLENGIDLFKSDSDGVTVLDMAIKFKRKEIVKFCIEQGFDLNQTKRKSGITPIMLASCFSDIEMMKILIDGGGDLNSFDKNGMSPKDYAKKLGQKKMLDFLNEQGAKFNVYKEE